MMMISTYSKAKECEKTTKYKFVARVSITQQRAVFSITFICLQDWSSQKPLETFHFCRSIEDVLQNATKPSLLHEY